MIMEENILYTLDSVAKIIVHDTFISDKINGYQYLQFGKYAGKQLF
jgi:hypothetical protein